MSKTIIIQKNGVAQTLTVDKLRLPDAAGGTENWLPADGKNLVNLEVKQNGTYKASDFSAYGIAEVKVKCTLNGGAATPKATEKLLNALHHPAPAEGGWARTMSAHHLETPQDGGGTVQWVPEEEVALGTKSVNIDNRTYKASDDGKYGWSQFIVSGISITKDGDTITHTDGTGTKTYTLPHHIRVEHPPLKTRYESGEAIDFTGMLVKAYNADNTLWTDDDHPDGVIPLEELTMHPTVAEGEAPGSIWSGYGVNAILSCSDGEWLGREYAPEGYRCTLTPNIALGRQNETILLTYYSAPQEKLIFAARYSGYIGTVSETSGHSSAGAWLGIDAGDTFVYVNANYITGIPESAVDPSNVSASVLIPDYAIITVEWARPYDFEILSDTFEIAVAEPTNEGGEGYGGAEGGGGQTSGGGAGRDN